MSLAQRSEAGGLGLGARGSDPDPDPTSSLQPPARSLFPEPVAVWLSPEGRAVPVYRELAERINRGEVASLNLRYSLDPAVSYQLLAISQTGSGSGSGSSG